MFPPVVVTMVIKILNKNVWKCLREGKVVDIGHLRPATLTKLILEVVKVVDISLKISATLLQVIAMVMDVGQVRPDTITLVIAEGILI